MPNSIYSKNHIYAAAQFAADPCEPAMAEPLTPPAVFKCLADDTRARLVLLILGEGELCVCELTCALDESQPKISRHLAQLRATGLLADRRQGQWVYYRLHPELPDWVQALLRTTLAANRPWLSPAAQRLEAMGERPQRAAACC
jgi:ArsR family transcriptional regulator, arsenate/arsenite/antimonite-responsive transcriptional repressor